MYDNNTKSCEIFADSIANKDAFGRHLPAVGHNIIRIFMLMLYKLFRNSKRNMIQSLGHIIIVMPFRIIQFRTTRFDCDFFCRKTFPPPPYFELAESAVTPAAAAVDDMPQTNFSTTGQTGALDPLASVRKIDAHSRL